MKTATVLNIIKNTSNKLLKIIDNFQTFLTTTQWRSYSSAQAFFDALEKINYHLY